MSLRAIGDDRRFVTVLRPAPRLRLAPDGRVEGGRRRGGPTLPPSVFCMTDTA
jgi:hypothetical protein